MNKIEKNKTNDTEYIIFMTIFTVLITSAFFIISK